MKSISKKLLLLPVFLLLFFSCITESQEQQEERVFTKSVERISANNFEKNLIDAAEKYYPPREDVVIVAGTSKLEIPQTKYWFYSVFDGVYIPYAITIDAIQYYSGLIDDFNSGKKETFFITAKFEYKAEVKFYNDFSVKSTESQATDMYKSVYVVTMNLKWENYCGSLCALWINKERVVVFNQAGELIKVHFDGITPVAVS